MPRATLRTRCGREVAIAYRLHSIETVSEAALQGRVTAPTSAGTAADAQAAATGPASRAEADSVAAVLDQRPRGHGIFSTRSFDGGVAAAALSNRHSEPLPSLSLRGLGNGPTGDGAREPAMPAGRVAVRQGSTGSIALAALDTAKCNGPLSDAGSAREDAAADEADPGDGAAGGGLRQGKNRPRVAREPQRLLVLGGMGARGDNGWFQHVVEHVASLRQPDSGDGAAVVCTMDYRCVPAI